MLKRDRVWQGKGPYGKASEMFKKTSQNEQRRETNSEFFSKKNINGVDESSFKGAASERDILVSKKIEIETNLSRLNATIAEASRRYNSRYSTMEHSETQFAKWKAQKQNLLNVLAGVTKRLSEIKLKETHLKDEKEKEFERAFVDAAKQVLAKPVFDRVVLAAIHMMKPE